MNNQEELEKRLAEGIKWLVEKRNFENERGTNLELAKNYAVYFLKIIGQIRSQCEHNLERTKTIIRMNCEEPKILERLIKATQPFIEQVSPIAKILNESKFSAEEQLHIIAQWRKAKLTLSNMTKDQMLVVREYVKGDIKW